jgi:chloramphenicol-sensitive protein RarD
VLGVNWFVFLYAVETDRVLHSSLGYFLNPIVSVLLGMLVLGERLRGLQWAAVMCAAIGVAVLFWRAGELPWIGLVLALAFGFYGLLRKTTVVDPLTGNMVENGMLAIPCLLAMAWLELGRGTGQLVGGDSYTAMLLLAAGPITAVPLLWFTAAARRLSMFTLGFMQYTTPTAHFLLAVFVFGEHFTPVHAVAFAAIWAGVGLFAVDLVLEQRRRTWA